MQKEAEFRDSIYKLMIQVEIFPKKRYMYSVGSNRKPLCFHTKLQKIHLFRMVYQPKSITLTQFQTKTLQTMFSQ